MYQKYKEAGYEIAYVQKYNAHNQFLEIMLDNGLVGLILFLTTILYQLRLIIKRKQMYFLAVYWSILVFLFTESLLERQNGVIIWSLFISLILRNIDNKNVSLNQISDIK